ncbi:ABC transporter ATP-binding protein [Parasphingopyxis marina]|uniref:ABC transporter ATP-binding protein n=1 Tax=Parasphingopyxis marina TaxID=2761622 RepID=A0A842HYD5_9SPHN|nr:ABC transporter ATP-binding protein [Parasphingopyxis marina]MBC2777845.1 ABC transporter ATP-binding protein [Parasphingopyxis marina]
MTARLHASAIALGDRLERCDLALEAGCMTMIVGPNGAGKTSLLRVLAGIGGDGDIEIDGEALGSLPPSRRAARLAFLGASRDIRWPLSARDFVALGLMGSADPNRVERALGLVDAEGFGARRLDRLSTGERSRIMIARALAPGAGVVLLDEPCANLDPKWQLVVLDRLRAEAQAGAVVALSIHDLDLARRHGDRVIVIEDGRIAADGPPAEALSDMIVERVFGIRRKQDFWIRA